MIYDIIYLGVLWDNDSDVYKECKKTNINIKRTLKEEKC